MRPVLLLFFFFMATRSFAQVEILGRYSASFLGSESINFVGKDSFYFEAFYCTNLVRGKGTCELRGNMLYLFFERSSKERDSAKLPEIAISDNKDGIADLHIQCVTLNNDPIKLGIVQIKKGDGKTELAYCDEAGKAYYRIKNADLPIELITNIIGTRNEKIKIDSLGDYNVRIFLDDNWGTEILNKGQVWSYEIDEISDDVIIMKPAKTAGAYRRYTKK
jgi:hypothetical protein